MSGLTLYNTGLAPIECQAAQGQQRGGKQEDCGFKKCYKQHILLL